MRRFGHLLIGLAFSSVALAADAPEKPILVLDTGGHTARVATAVFTPDGKTLITVSNEKTIRFWDVATGVSPRVLRPPIGRGFAGQLFAAAISPDGRTLAAGGISDGFRFYLIDVETGRIVSQLKGHTDVIQTLAFSADGKRLASGSSDGTDYPDKRLKLDCAAPDAQSLRQAFLTNSKKLFRGVEVKLLLNGQATRANILEGLQWLSRSVKPGDMAVVFYAGHGDCKIEGQFYLVPVDANLRDLSHTAISGEALKKAIGELPCTTMLLDACYAGSFDDKKRKKRSLPAESDAVLRQLVFDAGLVVMCGASKEQEAAEEDGHGFFTQSLVEGLGGKADYNKDGVVELYELQLYVHGRVRELSAQEQEPTVSIPSVVKSFALSRP